MCSQFFSVLLHTTEHCEKLLRNAQSRSELLRIVQYSSVPTILTTLSRTLVFIIGGYWVINDQMALGSLIAFSAYLGMAVGPVHTLLGLYVAIKRVRVSLDRVQELTLTKADVEPAQSKEQPLIIEGNISAHSLAFSYPNSNQVVFSDATFTIPSGAKVGVFGPSGIGNLLYIF